MEGLRLALLWLLVIRLNPGKSFPRRTADLAKKYLPYAIVVAAFLYWRYLFSPTRAPPQILARWPETSLRFTAPWRSHLADHPDQRLFRNRVIRLDSAALHAHHRRPPAGPARGGDRRFAGDRCYLPDRLADSAP